MWHETQFLPGSGCQESSLARQYGRVEQVKSASDPEKQPWKKKCEEEKKKSKQQTPQHPSACALRASCSTSNVAVHCCVVHAVLAPGDAAEPGFKDPSVNRGNLQGGVIFITLWLSPLKVHVAYSLQCCG